MYSAPSRPFVLAPAPAARWMPPPARGDLVAAGRRLARRLADCEHREALIAAALDGLIETHDLAFAAIALPADGDARSWHAQRGSAAAAQEDRLRRLAAAAARSGELLRADDAGPGLQRALPLRVRGRLEGVLVVAGADADAARDDALVLLAAHLAAMLAVLPGAAARAAAPLPATPTAARSAPAQATASDAEPPAVVRRYAANDSLFVDDAYLIKGVAANILWTLLRAHQRDGRCRFTNRELRVDPSLRLPEIGDNLEARLVLLRRRLAAHGALAQIDRTGRGRFELRLARPVQLVEVA